MVKRKTPALYPKPAPVKLSEPVRVVPVKKKRGRKVTHELEPSPELVTALQKLVETERERLDLIGRLRGYKALLLERVEPHCGKRPKQIPVVKWRDIAQRVKLIDRLVDDAPADVRHALLALHTLSHLNDALVKVRDITPEIRVAVCMAIDLGMLLQRGQVQIDFGADVDAGKRNRKSTVTANAAKQTAKQKRVAVAKAEFTRRRKAAPDRVSDETILTRMSEVKDTSGKGVYGSLVTLRRYKLEW